MSVDVNEDILGLPPLPSDHRDSTIEQLTRMLINAEEGELTEFVASGKTANGQHYTTASGCENVFEAAGHMIFVALRRMGLVTFDDLDEYVRRDEDC